MMRDTETHGLSDTAARRGVVRADMEEHIRAQGLYVAETRQLVAMCSYNTWAKDGVQIGGIWVPALYREKGYGAVAVAFFVERWTLGPSAEGRPSFRCAPSRASPRVTNECDAVPAASMAKANPPAAE
jgi:hypothetical protein